MILELALFLAAAPRQDPAKPPETPQVSAETQVLGNIKNQPLGKGTVDDLALPDEFLKRVSDHIIRASFEERYRIVVPDPPVQSALPPPNMSKPVDSSAFQPPSAVNLPLVIGTIVLLGFVAFIAITARSRKKMPL